MELTFTRDQLLAAVKAVSRVLSDKGPRPALHCIHIASDGEQVTLSASDLRVTIRYTLTPADVDGEGVAVVHGTKLSGIVSDTKADQIRLEIEDGRAILRAGRSRFTLTTIDPVEFPALVERGGRDVDVPAESFRRLVKRAAFAAAEAQGRYAIDGVHMLVEDGRLELAGTDGRRVAIASGPVSWGRRMARGIVPPKMLSDLAALLGVGLPESDSEDASEDEAAEATDDVSLAIRDGQLMAAFGPTLIASQLIEGTYPRYQDMVPAHASRTVTVDTLQLLTALRQARHMTTSESRAVTFTIDAGVMRLDASSPEVGKAAIEIDARYDGPEMRVAFNPQFLLDIVEQFDMGELTIEIDDGSKPAVIRSEGWTYVVAPVRVREDEPKDSSEAAE